jgi:acetolactate synthase-1/2/3 large subunit
MTQRLKASDYIAEFFRRHGITTCFSVTGGGAMHLNDSFGHGPGMRCVYMHHEQACAMAAEGFARTTGHPALVSVTSGPGTTNAMTGVLGAWLDSVPMVVLSGQMKRETTIASTPLSLRQLGFQEYNIIDSVRPMTKYAAAVTDVTYLAYHLERALQAATSGRQGPVWLDVPLDVQGSVLDPAAQRHFDQPLDDPIPPYVRQINPRLIDFVFERVNRATRPVLLVGYGVRMSAAHEPLLAAIERLRIPVVTEWNANDLIWNDHPYFAGRPGTIGDRGGNFVVQGADLLLTVGCQLSIRQISYAWQNFAPDAYVIGINPDRNELLKPTIRTDVPVVVDIAEFLEAVAASPHQSGHGTQTAWYHWCRTINARYPVVLPEQLMPERPLSVYAFFQRLSEQLIDDDHVVLANGAACVAGLQALRVRQGQRVFTNAGASSMGYGITAAIGAAVARGGTRRVICVEGDGSIQMNLQELQTIVHHALPITLFWINNDGYHSIRQTQKGMFRATERGYCGAGPDSGLSFPAAERIAAAYGIPFVRIASTADLEVTLRSALGQCGPVLCEVVTDPEEELQPKLQSRLLEDGTFVTPSLEDMYPFLSREELEAARFTPPERPASPTGSR